MCGTPDGDEPHCPGCGWLMWDDPVLGEPTDTDRESAAALLQAAERAWDLRAAALTGAGAGGEGQTASVLRGGPAGAGELDPATPPAPPPGPAAHDSTRWEQTLADLVDGRIDSLLFIEFASEGVSLVKAVVDRSGIPRQSDAGSTRWSRVAPLLDPREDIRRFQLAGGIGDVPVVGRAEFDTAVTRWLRGHVPPSCAHTIVLVDRRAGWLLLDRAAALLRTMYTPRAELVPRRATFAPGPRTACRPDTEEAVRGALRTAPLHVDHTLLLARVDRVTGAVHPHPHVLFPAGSRLRHGETATTEITVHGWPSDCAVELPVLDGATTGGAEPVVLSAPRTTVAAFAPARLSFVLRGPGRVELLQAGHEPPNDPAEDGTSRKHRQIPALFEGPLSRIVRPPALDVFFTVEMSGAEPEETAERLAFVRDVIAALARRYGAGDGLRVGVVGHYDHVVREAPYTPLTRLRRTVPAGPAQSALASLADWRPARREQDTVSSLEDALKEVRSVIGRKGGPRHRQAERALLIVARRPPAPPEQRDVVPACPLGADWRTELEALRARGVRVRTRPERNQPYSGKEAGTAQRYAADAWDTLSAAGSFRQDVDTAADVAEALAPEWRWDGPPCRYALAAPLL
ncbi:hypothetical protein AB0G54_07165 [Streptomyces yokosukanensis]|uniref:hypothetical protein n=1 Tax=Streptomyces yokosukanensis TaxID=67386 RepID=UPI00341622DF